MRIYDTHIGTRIIHMYKLFFFYQYRKMLEIIANNFRNSSVPWVRFIVTNSTEYDNEK